MQIDCLKLALEFLFASFVWKARGNSPRVTKTAGQTLFQMALCIKWLYLLNNKCCNSEKTLRAETLIVPVQTIELMHRGEIISHSENVPLAIFCVL